MIAKIGNCYFKLLYIPIFFQKFQIRNTEFFLFRLSSSIRKISFTGMILLNFIATFVQLKEYLFFCFVMLILINSWSLQTTIYQSFILQQKG